MKLNAQSHGDPSSKPMLSKYYVSFIIFKTQFCLVQILIVTNSMINLHIHNIAIPKLCRNLIGQENWILLVAINQTNLRPHIKESLIWLEPIIRSPLLISLRGFTSIGFFCGFSFLNDDWFTSIVVLPFWLTSSFLGISEMAVVL